MQAFFLYGVSKHFNGYANCSTAMHGDALADASVDVGVNRRRASAAGQRDRRVRFGTSLAFQSGHQAAAIVVDDCADVETLQPQGTTRSGEGGERIVVSAAGRTGERH